MTPQKQFLCKIDTYSHGTVNDVEYADVYLSAYSLNEVKKLSNISNFRFVEGTDIEFRPGFGKGTVNIAGETFTVHYAWGHGDDQCYTVRLTGSDVIKRLDKIKEKIIIDEEGCLKYKVSFRDYNKEMGVITSEIYERRLLDLNVVLGRLDDAPLKPLSKERIKKEVAAWKEKWEKDEKCVSLYNSMKEIESYKLYDRVSNNN